MIQCCGTCKFSEYDGKKLTCKVLKGEKMKCDDCGKEIKKGMAGWYVHVHSGSIYCYPNKTATPRKLPGPGEWCTGQQWVDAGGDWNEFVEAHKNTQDAQVLFNREWVDAGNVCIVYYEDEKEFYRLRLDDKGELPGPEDCESCTKIEAEALINTQKYEDCKIDDQGPFLKFFYCNIWQPLNRAVIYSEFIGYVYQINYAEVIRIEPILYRDSDHIYHEAGPSTIPVRPSAVRFKRL